MAEKVTFDGLTKIISVNLGVTYIDVKKDLYSAWKRWVYSGDGAKWQPAFLTSGGDPLDVAETQFSPQFFFLTNGWRIAIDTGEEILFQYNLFTFNPDGIVFNLTNSSSVRVEISQAPVVSGSTIDLTTINDKLDSIQTAVNLIKLATDNMTFSDSRILASLDSASQQTIRDSLALSLSLEVIKQIGSVDNIIDRIDSNTQV